MSNSSSNQCTYTYDPPGPEESVDRVTPPSAEYDGCPHESIDPDERRCLFHSSETAYPSERFTEQFRQVLTDETVRPTFAGGKLGPVDLAGETVTSATGDPLDLRGALIDGDLDLTEATVEVPLLLDGVAITGSLHATDATFHGPISLASADIEGRIHCHGMTVAGGVFGSHMNVGYVDARDITVDGPLLLTEASFASNLLLARARVDGAVTLTGATFDWSLDATNLSSAGDLFANDVSIDDECDLVAAEIDGAVEFRKLTVGEETDWSHATIGGKLTVTDADFGAEANFSDVSIGGDVLNFDGSRFDGTADFGTLTIADGRASFTDVSFDDEVWFTHARIHGQTDFGRARFAGMTHLRDATFEDDLVLRGAESTGQFFLHGTTIGGDCDCTAASFEHFQFSATVDRKADFSDTTFVEKALFKSSTFGDRVWFDRASFAGHPDFSDTRFTGETSFDGTEFLVEPTFADTRFAVGPDLTGADFPLADDIDLADRRERMILAHPESLENEGMTLPLEQVTGSFSVPSAGAHLVEDDFTRTKVIAQSLADFDARAWHATVDEQLRTARTAVARLPETTDATIVFGLRVNTNGPPDATRIDEVMVAGVYCRHDDEIVFGHLDPTFLETEYLVPIPAADDAFESGAAVATTNELRNAAIRNEMFRAATLGKRREEDSSINNLIVPVLVGAGELGVTG